MSNEEIRCCRLCFDPDTEPADPLLEPCKCSGSMACIHESCLFASRTQTFSPSALTECG